MPVQDVARWTVVAAAAAGLMLTDPVTADETAPIHGNASGRETPNRLARETSPYLIQHAWNPVEWHPWGEEAFELARQQNKPIFLSIGYSTCYWCHVMERESFEDPRIAAVLNEYFIPVKVDREERPDVDEIYMTAVQIMTRHGGWPLSVWLEPDTLKPFFGGTYFPPKDQGERPGFMTLLHAIHQAWKEKEPEMLEQADRVAAAVERRLAETHTLANPERSVVDDAVSQLLATFDPVHGGYGDAPKFPMPVHLNFLQEAAWDRPDVQASVVHTLDQMAMGGMYDQVGGGFHRYSTDERWLVPHFEKMLYDNAMLASVYARSYELTGNGFHGAIARETLDYVLRDMVDASGAFWSAQDAESNAREGQSYLWTSEEIQEAINASGLPADMAAFAIELYGLDRGANFRDPHHPAEPASNVLFLSSHPRDIAADMGQSIAEFHQNVTRINAALLAHRDLRDQPSTDDKILAGWNGLMIAGLADGGRVFDEPRYIQAAQRALEWIRESMWTRDGGLKRSAREGRVAEIDGFLEDYAFLVRGLLSVYEATGDRSMLTWAEQLMEQAKERFFDESAGWFDVEEGDPSLFVRGRSLYDGAVPSGTSVMLDNMRRLHSLTGEAVWLGEAAAALHPVAAAINRAPRGAAQSLVAIHHLRAADADRFTGDLAKTEPAGPVTVSLGTTSRGVDGLETSVILEIPWPWHVALPGGDGVVGLHIETATPGASVEFTPPTGQPYDGPIGGLQVVVGRVEIPVRIRGAEGPITLQVTWQACDDRLCLAPRTDRLLVSFGDAP